MSPRPRKCARCKLKRQIRARELCSGCYSTIYKRGALAGWDPRNRRSWAFTEDYLFIKASEGLKDEDIADRMGISHGALKQRLRLRREWGQL